MCAHSGSINVEARQGVWIERIPFCPMSPSVGINCLWARCIREIHGVGKLEYRGSFFHCLSTKLIANGDVSKNQQVAV